MSRTKTPRHIIKMLLAIAALFLSASISHAEEKRADMIESNLSTLINPPAETKSNQYFDPEADIEEFDEADLIVDHHLDYDDNPMRSSLRKPEQNDSNRNWWYLLRHGRLNTADTTVQYPKFLNFCMKVYRWADKAFNSYDTTYVVGTGRRWKARLLCDNWMDSYYINPGKKIPIRMMSNPYVNIGAYLQYMAVSIGYSVDINNLIGNNPANHQKIEYTFNCARFNIEGHIWKNTGGTYIRTFGGYNNGHLIKRYFDGVKLQDFEVYGYYFLNNRKFSMGAAYNFSKFQLKSAGSAVIGIG
ncbi:MAG: DUF4421 domain-containing protein, partial [Muribaculaceae bacterium]|nr:DUF4421 domain-containing protein [Muribaculaceae bacterium]